MSRRSGSVVLVGAGPGDPDLLTVRALRELREAEVLLYDALIPRAIIDLAHPACECIDVGKRGDGTRGVALADIASLMLEKARAGKRVVRLKGGDPFLFGRGGEEASAVVEAGIPFEVVPGVSSALAVPAYAGIPITDRRLSSSVAIVTGHRGRQPTDEQVHWEALAQSAETLVILMGTRWLADIVERLIAGGRDPATPAAVIESGTTPAQRVVTAPLAELAERASAAGLSAPTTIVIGEVARLRESLAWYERRPLYGRRLLVTRAESQAGEWSVAIVRSGAHPVAVPLLEFEPPQDRGALRQARTEVGRYDWLVFTSANAVRAFAREASGPPAAGSPRVACVGAATAAVARELGMNPEVEPPGASDPEALVAALRRETSLAGARVLWPRAAAAHDTLALALRREGAEVDAVDAYRTTVPSGAAEGLERALAAGVDAVLLASPSAVDALVDLLGEPRARDLARSAVFACIGPTTAKALRERGLDPAVVSERQSGDDLVRALERHFAEESDDVP